MCFSGEGRVATAEGCHVKLCAIGSFSYHPVVMICIRHFRMTAYEPGYSQRNSEALPNGKLSVKMHVPVTQTSGRS